MTTLVVSRCLGDLAAVLESVFRRCSSGFGDIDEAGDELERKDEHRSGIVFFRQLTPGAATRAALVSDLMQKLHTYRMGVASSPA